MRRVRFGSTFKGTTGKKKIFRLSGGEVWTTEDEEVVGHKPQPQTITPKLFYVSWLSRMKWYDQVLNFCIILLRGTLSVHLHRSTVGALVKTKTLLVFVFYYYDYFYVVR